MILKNVLTVLSLLFLAAPGLQAEVNIDGFLQMLQGARLDQGNPTATEMTASETRFQLRVEQYGDAGEFFARLDFIYDGADEAVYDWELREGYLKFRMGQNFDFKIGRQILTWGTGDLIFINDMFVKDYRSFFVGRDDQYLKAPQNAMRIDGYTGLGSLSFVWTPDFEANRLPTGRRLSYFNGQEIVGEEFYLDPPTPDPKFENGEFAFRFSRSLAGFSSALYFYKGFYKNPVGVEMVMIDDMPEMMPVYPRLNVYGASVRGQVVGGILWLEGGFYESRWDIGGANPLMPNSHITAISGYERQVASNLTANIQWQVEYMLDHDLYRVQREADEMFVRDEIVHLLTSRVTKLLMDELLNLSSFIFYSPTNEDLYLRLLASYKYSDEITVSIGGNLFDGKHIETDFGQFRKNDNVYMKFTYGF